MSRRDTRRLLVSLLAQIRKKYVSKDEFWRIYTDSQKDTRVLTVNIEILRLLLSDCKPLDQADICTIDSSVLQYVFGRFFRDRFDRLTGREIVEHSAMYLNERDVWLFGATEHARRQAVERFSDLDGSSIAVHSLEDPSSGIPPSTINGKCAAFFAYGFPKQEGKIDEFVILSPPSPTIVIGVGGAIDYFSGIVRRPPALVSSLGFEWLWRLIMQPNVRLRRILTIIPLAIRLIFLSQRGRWLG